MSLMMSNDRGISAFPDGDKLFSWIATVTGPKDTVYEGESTWAHSIVHIFFVITANKMADKMLPMIKIWLPLKIRKVRIRKGYVMFTICGYRWPDEDLFHLTFVWRDPGLSSYVNFISFLVILTWNWLNQRTRMFSFLVELFKNDNLVSPEVDVIKLALQLVETCCVTCKI